MVYNSTAVGHKSAGRAKINDSAGLAEEDYIAIARKVKILKPSWVVALIDGGEADGAIVALIADDKRERRAKGLKAFCCVLASDSDFLVFAEMGRGEQQEDLVDALFTPTKKYASPLLTIA